MVPLCSYWPAEARNQPSPGGYWDACWGLAQEASSEDRWQLRSEKNQNVYRYSFCTLINVQNRSSFLGAETRYNKF